MQNKLGLSCAILSSSLTSYAEVGWGEGGWVELIIKLISAKAKTEAWPSLVITH